MGLRNTGNRANLAYFVSLGGRMAREDITAMQITNRGLAFKTTAIDHSAIPPRPDSRPELAISIKIQADSSRQCNRKCNERDGAGEARLCDRDRKWSADVRRQLRDAGIRVVLIPERAPPMRTPTRNVSSDQSKKNAWTG